MILDRQALVAAMEDLPAHVPHLPELADGTAVRDRLGVREFPGGSAVVFKVRGAIKTWALRFSERDALAVVQHHLQVRAHLDARPGLSCLFPWFEARNDGLWLPAQRRWIPMVRMEWLQGRGLLSEVHRCLADSAALRRLADGVLHALESMHQHVLTHGDLQPRNLVVQSDGAVRLIDLDDVVLDSNVDTLWATGGFGGYAHPGRADSTARTHGVDLFPGLVMVLGLRGLAADPGLWERLELEGTGLLLCGPEDYIDPWASARLKALESVNSELADLVQKLRLLAGIDVQQLAKLGSPARLLESGLRGSLARLAGGW